MKKQPVFRSLIALALLLGIVWSCKKEETAVVPTPAVKSAAKDITKFSFAALSPAVDGTIDATAKTISATVPAATDLTKLVPTITISDKATISPATGTAQDFSKEVTYTLTAEDASTQVWKVNVAITVPAKVCKLTNVDLSYGGGWKFEYDTQSRLIKQILTTSEIVSTTVYTYDTNGFLTQDKTTGSYKTTPTYIYATEITNTYTYSDNKLAKVSDYRLYSDNKSESSITELFEYDAQGNVSKYVEKGGTATFANGNITGYTQEGSTIERNTQGFVSKNTNTYSGNYTVYTYDSNNQLLTQTDYTKAGVKETSLTYQYSTTKYNTASKRVGLETPTTFKGFPTSNYSVTGIRVYAPSKLVVDLPQYSINNDITFTYDAKGKLISEYNRNNTGYIIIYNYTYQDCN